MPTLFYADVHIPAAVVAQLRSRGVDIFYATELGHERKTDEELLIFSTSTGRVMVTQDIGFRVMAEEWQRIGRSFSGLVFAHQLRVSYGQLVNDLELIANATDAMEWLNVVEQLPL
jgi:hypothetical protein